MIKKSVMIIFSSVILSTSAVAYEDFGEIQDIGIWNNIMGMYTFQIHYQNWLFYTINVGTPGFVETGVYNTRRKGEGHRIDYMPFYRWRAGPVSETKRMLDFYLDSGNKGLFVIKMPTTLGYTRDGRFKLDAQKRLVTVAGNFPVMGLNGEIFFREGTDITVSRSGALYEGNDRVDQMRIVVFKSTKQMQSLESLNGSHFILTKEIETVEGPEHYSVHQFYVQDNNVLKAITGDILVAKNGYDANAKIAHLINRVLQTSATIASP
jgi:flagellar basal body rod protein FlgG